MKSNKHDVINHRADFRLTKLLLFSRHKTPIHRFTFLSGSQLLAVGDRVLIRDRHCLFEVSLAEKECKVAPEFLPLDEPARNRLAGYHEGFTHSAARTDTHGDLAIFTLPGELQIGYLDWSQRGLGYPNQGAQLSFPGTPVAYQCRPLTPDGCVAISDIAPPGAARHA